MGMKCENLYRTKHKRTVPIVVPNLGDRPLVQGSSPMTDAKKTMGT